MRAESGVSSRSASPDPVPRSAWLVGRVLLVEVAAFLLFSVPGVRSSAGFVPLIDGWLQGAGYVTAALLAALVPLHRSAVRTIWSWVAAALAARALGFVLWLSVVRPRQAPGTPSVADAAWLAMYPLILAGLVVLARAHARRLSSTVALDGAVAALAAAAVAVTLLYPTIITLTAPGTPAVLVAVSLAYPVLDVMLLVALIGVLVVLAWHPPPAVWALAAGLLGFAVVDAWFLYEAAAGVFRPGTPVSAVSLALASLIAAAGWLPQERRDDGHDRLPSVVLPGLFALTCLGLLLFATRQPVPFLGVVFAGLGITAAITRTALSFRTVRALAEHRREARTDELTGLPNRRAFNERLRGVLAHRVADRRHALLVVDLDDFKAVNDALGHHYGDELLRLAAPRLQQAVRGGDLVARIGGDEFAVLLADADGDRAVSVAERLRTGFRRPFRLGSRDVLVAPSVGIALVPDDGREPVELLQHADLAMYEAKATRSGYALFQHRLHPSGRRRMETTERLRRAIEDDEIVVHYQPQVALPDGAVVGVEALVRWQHPQAGLVLPSGFLQQAESGDLMRSLTGVVLGQALRQAAAWHARGLRLTMAVNLSVTNLLDARFPEQVSDLLTTTGLPAGALELELTEDLFMADPARARGAVGALLDAGVSLVVDDYGTGYSSLGYLRDLHDIRGLKLDRSFVTHLDSDPRSAAIVESTIKLAHALDMHVIGEGVESGPVRDRLADLGCEVAQGFLFGRPVAAHELDLTAVRPLSESGGPAGRDVRVPPGRGEADRRTATRR